MSSIGRTPTHNLDMTTRYDEGTRSWHYVLKATPRPEVKLYVEEKPDGTRQLHLVEFRALAPKD